MTDDDHLLDAYRIIRRLDASEAPFAGLLVHAEGSGSTVLVDVEAVGDDWIGWSAAHDGHILAPLDVVRQAGGHAVALPACDERLDAFLARRTDSPLTDGERLTLSVSLVRGFAEVARLAGATDATGSWWLADGGRPVVAVHDSVESIASATERLLRELTDAAGHPLRDALNEAGEALREPARLTRRLTGLEERLFSAATPEPLATTVYAPRRARALAAATAGERPGLDEDREPGVVARLVRNVDADLADTVSLVTTGVWRRLRRDGEPRRTRPVLVAGLAAAVVVTGGLLWPVGSGGPATAQGVRSSGTPLQEPTADESSPAPSSLESSSIESTVDSLLTKRVDCAGAEPCLAELLEDPAKSLPGGVVELPSGERTITLLDDFGGAAVVRVDSLDGASEPQLVVVIRMGEKWVLRDVHDVAEHPQ